ncbi:transcriptional regulator RcsB [Kordia sp. SMS9]|uniref:response regulator n=1 Tax=Kordia sp. SMS9 TaxID=2282170 RepID=UPI000E0D31A4|nr:response regulator [Kordia sp. SMS9]AXG70029.1 transcriptional regulator RcsB [Kordia sp. SMS9]
MKFKKVLVAEDTDSSNIGLVYKLKEIGIETVESSQSCDNAILKLKKGIHEKRYFDLLISDLSFVSNTPNPKITTGEALIEEVKRLQPTIKIIAFSVNNQQTVIKHLINEIDIDSYVCKGLNGTKELLKAIELIQEDEKYLCPISSATLHQKNVFQLDDYEKQLLQLVARGLKQDEIAVYFQSKGISPNSRRSVEDRLSRLRDNFNASTTSQLIYLAQSLDLI